MKTNCHTCNQPFDYKIVNIHYNSICPSCLEKNPHIMQEINEAHQKYEETLCKADVIFHEIR